MTVLFAIKSCRLHQAEGRHYTIRDTWGLGLAPHLRFFMGRESEKPQINQMDETILDVNDGYDSLPYKTRSILQWFLNHDQFTYSFLADSDTYIKIEKLMRSGFENFDYFGKISRPLGKTFPYAAIDRHGNITDIPECFGWASGGFGYFVSRKAAKIIVDYEPICWAEDLGVGQVMGRAYNEGLVKIGDMVPNVSTWHAPPGSDSAKVREWMNQMYRTHRQ